MLTNGESMNWSDDELTFAVDSMAGTLTEPATLRFGTSVQDYVNIFPNPSNGVFNIEGKGIRKILEIDIPHERSMNHHAVYGQSLGPAGAFEAVYHYVITACPFCIQAK